MLKPRLIVSALLGASTLTILAVLGNAAAVSGSAGRTSHDPAAPSRDEPLVVSLAPSKDNTLYESVDGNTSNGKGSHLFVGNSNESVIRRAVLEFDLTAVIPGGAEVDSVTLSLNMSKTTSGAQVVRLHRLTREWGEGESNADANEGSGAPTQPGDATWLNAFHPDRPWTNPGGDYATAPSAQTSVSGAGRYEWSSSDMEDEVELWLADPEDNHGWILVGQEVGTDGGKLSRTSKRFDSVDNADIAVRPRLIVVYRLDDSTSTPETRTPETSTPETSTPETRTPETSTPETSTPETSTPETSTPETRTPETATTPARRSLIFLPCAQRGT